MIKEISRNDLEASAVRWASKIYLDIIKNGGENIEHLVKLAMKETLETRIVKKTDTRSIDCLSLPKPYLYQLRKQGIKTIQDLLNEDRDSIRHYRNFGKVRVALINKAIKKLGIETQPFSTSDKNNEKI
jgi:DNA-directed RNA polymerase alpha subunit